VRIVARCGATRTLRARTDIAIPTQIAQVAISGVKASWASIGGACQTAVLTTLAAPRRMESANTKLDAVGDRDRGDDYREAFASSSSLVADRCGQERFQCSLVAFPGYE
jgi:hypothetical protein